MYWRSFIVIVLLGCILLYSLVAMKVDLVVCVCLQSELYGMLKMARHFELE
jgi:hypothetical protein